MVSSNPSNGLIYLQQYQCMKNQAQTSIFCREKNYSEGNFSIQYFELFFFPETAFNAQTVFISVCALYNTYFRYTAVRLVVGGFKSLQSPYYFYNNTNIGEITHKTRDSVEKIIRKEIFQISSLNFSLFLKLSLTRRLSSLAFVARIIHTPVAKQIG